MQKIKERSPKWLAGRRVPRLLERIAEERISLKTIPFSAREFYWDWGGDSEGRDLLPRENVCSQLDFPEGALAQRPPNLIGTNVTTLWGPVRTDFVLVVRHGGMVRRKAFEARSRFVSFLY